MLPNQGNGLPENVSGEDAGAAPAPVVEPGTQGNEPEFATREDLQKFADGLFRSVQSLVDKNSYRLAQEISSKVQQAKEAYALTGKTLTDDELAVIRNNATMQAVAALPPEPSPVPAGGQPAAGGGQGGISPEIEMVNATAARIVAPVGGILQTDPESARVVWNGTKEEFLASVAEAAYMKQQRIALQVQGGAGAGGFLPAAGFVGSTGNPVQMSNPRDDISEGLK